MLLGDHAVSTVMVAGDWHGNTNWAYSLAQKAKRLRISRLVQLGDFGLWPRDRAYLITIDKIAMRTGIEISTIGGNHEDYDQLAELLADNPRDKDGFVVLRPRLKWIPRGHRWEWEGIRFGAIGGAFSVDWRDLVRGTSWWPGVEEVQPEDVARLGSEAVDVLFTHDAPDGAEPLVGHWDIDVTSDAQARVSRLLLRQAVDAVRPKLVVHGHWHVRNRRHIEEPTGRMIRVEGLASDQEGDGTAWGVLDLDDLTFVDGRVIEAGWLAEKFKA